MYNLYTYMGFDPIMQEGHGEFALPHHHTIWIFLYCSHLVLELLEGRLFDHTGVCWNAEYVDSKRDLFSLRSPIFHIWILLSFNICHQWNERPVHSEWECHQFTDYSGDYYTSTLTVFWDCHVLFKVCTTVHMWASNIWCSNSKLKTLVFQRS